MPKDQATPHFGWARWPFRRRHFTGSPARVRHVPQVPRSEVACYFIAADCFVFPSLFEGSAIVLCEACGAGFGIIQSERSGDGARPGQNGIVLSERSPFRPLRRPLSRLRETPVCCSSGNATSWAGRGEKHWERYRRRVVELVLQWCI